MARLVLLAALIAVSGCGYRVGALSNDAPAGVRTIAVPTFQNKTYEPGLELSFTDRLRGEVARGSGVALALDSKNADAVFSGEVLSFRAIPTVLVPLPSVPGTSGGSQDRRLPTRYRAIVEVRVSLVSVTTGEVLWEDRLEGTEEYDSGQAPEGFEPLAREAQQQAAISAIAADLMREAYDRMLTDF